MRYKMEQLDMMEGHEFEYAVADLLRHNGWRDVEVPRAAETTALTSWPAEKAPDTPYNVSGISPR